MKKQVAIYGRDTVGAEFARRCSRKAGWQVDAVLGGSDRVEHRRDRRRIRPGLGNALFLGRRHRVDAIVVRSLRDVEMSPYIVRRLIRSLARRRVPLVALVENLDTLAASGREVDDALEALALWGRTEGWRIGCERAQRLGICGRPYCDVDPFVIVRLLRDGRSPEEIGRRLGVSATTVRRRVLLFGSDEDIALLRPRPPSRHPGGIPPRVPSTTTTTTRADLRALLVARLGQDLRIRQDA